MRETRGTTTKRMQRRGGTTKTALPYPQPLLCAAAAAASRIARHDQRPSYPGREHRAQRAREELAADCSVCCCIRGRRHSLFFLPLSLSLSLSLYLSLSLSLSVSRVSCSGTREQTNVSLCLSLERERERERERESRGRERERPSALSESREQRGGGERHCASAFFSLRRERHFSTERERLALSFSLSSSLFLSLAFSFPRVLAFCSPPVAAEREVLFSPLTFLAHATRAGEGAKSERESSTKDSDQNHRFFT